MSMKNIVLFLALCACSFAAASNIAPPPPGSECEEDIVFRKWNDLLFVNNGDGRFVTFQWYRDDQPIAGATYQYLHELGVVLQGDGHKYRAFVTDANGKTYWSCPLLFEEHTPSQPLNPYGGVAKVQLYHGITGRKVAEWNAVPEEVSVPAGLYVMVVTNTEGENHTTKLVVK